MPIELSERAINEIATIGLQSGVLVAGAILYLLVARRGFRIGWFLGALTLFAFYDFLLTRAFYEVPNVIGERWNWTGKLMAIAGTPTVATLPMFGWRKVGITLWQAPGSWTAWVLLAVLSSVIFYFAYTGGNGRSDWETIAFQWTMPGFDEELFYRGALLVALSEAFRGKMNVLGASIGWGGVLTCILFGAIHTLRFDGTAIAFDPMTFAMTGVPAAILLWMREKTGSLVAPVIGHNVTNGAFNLF